MADINEKMREEFESWAAVKFAVGADLLAKSRTDEDMDSGFPYRVVNRHGEESDLVNTLIGTAWAGWQASRTALVIDLPEPQPFEISDEESLDMDPEEFERLEARHGAQYSAYRKCRNAIEAAGLKVTP